MWVRYEDSHQDRKTLSRGQKRVMGLPSDSTGIEVCQSIHLQELKQFALSPRWWILIMYVKSALRRFIFPGLPITIDNTLATRTQDQSKIPNRIVSISGNNLTSLTTRNKQVVRGENPTNDKSLKPSLHLPHLQVESTLHTTYI